MIVVVFELWPEKDRRHEYMDLTISLSAELETVDGFLSVERFASLSDEGKYLSLSFWRDEVAVKRWRTQANHRKAQASGRAGIFRDYRLRIASVIRDYGMHERDQVPEE